MTRRYFAPELPPQGGVIALDEFESHHAVAVMRLREGDAITLFDGRGNEAMGTVVAQTKRVVHCQTESAQFVDRENPFHLTLGIGMPKGDRSKELVERLTELGVSALVPLTCQRTQWPISENTITKWQRLVIDSCKQSGRNQLMTIRQPMRLGDWLGENIDTVHKLIAHPPATSLPQACSLPSPVSTAVDQPLKPRIHIAIGPEGGFTDDEVAQAEQTGWSRLALGNRIYRIETAAVVAAVRLMSVFEPVRDSN